jgi:hypothetical protein
MRQGDIGNGDFLTLDGPSIKLTTPEGDVAKW